MKKVLVCFFVLGMLGFLITQIFLKNKIPENLSFPLCLLWLGIIYGSYLAGFISGMKNGETEKPKITFYNFRFFLGLISYPLVVSAYVLFKIIEKIK